MTPEKQRIKIAEACGWTHYLSAEDGWERWVTKDPTGTVRSESGLGPKELRTVKSNTEAERWPLYLAPDYLNDLNAMHEAEKVLTGHRHVPPTEQARSYFDVLLGIGGCDTLVIFTTAAQRAEAFLRVLNLWEDGK